MSDIVLLQCVLVETAVKWIIALPIALLFWTIYTRLEALLVE
jgi:hypothetical protein